MMEYLYNVNPILTQDTMIVIYGTGEAERGIFSALLQQNIYVTAFVRREDEECKVSRILNKKIIELPEVKECYPDAYVIVAGIHAKDDASILRDAGIENIIVENITLNGKRIVLVGE